MKITVYRVAPSGRAEGVTITRSIQAETAQTLSGKDTAMNKMNRRTLPLMISALFAVAAEARPRYGLAIEVAADVHAKMPDATKALYKDAGEGKFRLEVEGLEDTGALHRALQAERDAVKTLKEEKRKLAEQYKDVDPAKYKEMLAQLEDEDDKRLLKDNKLEDLITKRTEKMKKQLEGERDAALNESKAEKTRREKYEAHVMENHIRTAAIKAGMHASAMEDAILRAGKIFTLDENVQAVRLGSDGKPVYGKDGKTPYNAAEWVEEMKKEAPHWFPAGSSGGGSGGDKGGSGGAKTMKRADFDAIKDPAEKAKIARDKSYTFVD